MIPVQMNPMATQGLTEMYRQQRAMMEQARDIQQAAKTGQVIPLRLRKALGWCRAPVSARCSINLWAR